MVFWIVMTSCGCIFDVESCLDGIFAEWTVGVSTKIVSRLCFLLQLSWIKYAKQARHKVPWRLSWIGIEMSTYRREPGKQSFVIMYWRRIFCIRIPSPLELGSGNTLHVMNVSVSFQRIRQVREENTHQWDRKINEECISWCGVKVRKFRGECCSLIFPASIPKTENR